jgi:hypothetical protein
VDFGKIISEGQVGDVSMLSNHPGITLFLAANKKKKEQQDAEEAMRWEEIKKNRDFTNQY